MHNDLVDDMDHSIALIDILGYDMVGEDTGQLNLIFRFHQHIDRTFRQLIKRFIRRGKDGERTGAFQGFYQAGSFYSRNVFL
jgi:hypothetical protein